MGHLITEFTMTDFQTHFINLVNNKLTLLSHYSLDLFFTVAAIECVIFGLYWAFRNDTTAAQAIWVMIKLTLIFLAVTYLPIILQYLIDGITFLSDKTHASNTINYISQPGAFINLLSTPSVQLMKISIIYGDSNLGASIMYLVFSFVCLFSSIIMVASSIIAVFTFYISSLIGIVLLPFSAFNLLKNLFSTICMTIVKSSIKILAIAILLNFIASIYEKFGNLTINESTSIYTLITIMSFYLISALALWKLPNFISTIIPSVTSALSISTPSQSGIQSHNLASSTQINTSNSVSPNLTHASSINKTHTDLTTSSTFDNTSNQTQTTSSSSSSNLTSDQNSSISIANNNISDQSTVDVKRTISDETLTKIKKTFKQALDENR